MNWKKLFLATLAIFVAFTAIDTVFHGVLLSDTYAAMAHVWRPEAEMMNIMWLMNLLTLFYAFMFTFIFAKGYEGKGLMEGVRYGLLIGLLTNVMGMYGQYFMYPIPLWLATVWFVYGMLSCLVAGVIAAAVYRPAKKDK